MNTVKQKFLNAIKESKLPKNKLINLEKSIKKYVNDSDDSYNACINLANGLQSEGK